MTRSRESFVEGAIVMANKTNQKISRRKPGLNPKEKRAAKKATHARRSALLISSDGPLRAAGLLR